MPRPVVWYTDGDSRAPTIDPYRRLCIAVLEGCKTDLQLAVSTSASVNVANAQRERDWLWSTDHDPMSFLWLCDVLSLDPDATRMTLLSAVHGQGIKRLGGQEEGEHDRGEDREGEGEVRMERTPSGHRRTARS